MPLRSPLHGGRDGRRTARAGAREPRGDARRAVERLAVAPAVDAERAGVVRHRADGRVLQLENGVYRGRVCPRESGGHDGTLRRALGRAALVNPAHAARGGWLLQRGVVCGGGRLHGRWRIGLVSEQREGGPDRTVEWITVADPAAAGDAPSGGVGNAHRRLMPGAARVHGGRRSLRSKRRQSARGAGRERARLDEPAATTRASASTSSTASPACPRGDVSPSAAALSVTDQRAGAPRRAGTAPGGRPCGTQPSPTSSQGVSCRSAKACTAVGGTDGLRVGGFAGRWNGRRWSSVDTVSSSFNAELNGDSCPSTDEVRRRRAYGSGLQPRAPAGRRPGRDLTRRILVVKRKTPGDDRLRRGRFVGVVASRGPGRPRKTPGKTISADSHEFALAA